MKGIPVSPGLSIGKVFLYAARTLNVPSYPIAESEVASEVERFYLAVSKVKSDLDNLLKRAKQTKGTKDIDILETHVMMIDDPDLKNQIAEGISAQQINAEKIVEAVITMMAKTLETSGDEYLRERAEDLIDIQSRILHHLMYIDRTSLADIQEEVILVAQNLLPSEVLTMNKKFIKGILLDAGGKTSHTAILARSFEIPSVLGLSNISQEVKNGSMVIVDGNTGEAILQPSDEVIANFEKKLKSWEQHEKDLLTLNTLPAETKDGHKVELKANIEIPEEVASVLIHGGSGIGLYRSEFLFLRPGEAATEDEQFDAYAYVLKKMNGKGPVTIRTIDVGGDKMVPGFKDSDEENPILGWRAVRFCLSRKDIFLIQLRALLRASVYGQLRIMFPMISGKGELDEVLEVLEEAKEECRQKGLPFDESIQVGSMIEVPSAALVADILAERLDFFSIGTNDLIQYTIAVDRGNEKIAYLYQPFHPGVIRLLKMIIESGHQAGVPVAMCGEMASDPLSTVLLLGLGLDEFSMSPTSILEVKKIIRSVTIEQARALVETVMKMKTAREINTYIQDWSHENIDIYSF